MALPTADRITLQSIIDGIEDGKYNRIPPAVYFLDRSVSLNRPFSNRTVIDFYGSLIIQPPQLFALRVETQFQSGGENPSPFYERHATGQIIAGVTDRLTWASSAAKPNVGDQVIVRAGVNYSDPNEPANQFIRTVAAVEGNTIIFDRAFEETVRVYASVAELQAITYDYLWNKIGPTWGVQLGSGYYARALGLDHGIGVATGGRMMRNATVINPSFASAPSGLAYDGGAGGIFLFSTVDTHLEAPAFANPQNICIHFWAGDNTNIYNPVATGVGSGSVYTPGDFASRLLTVWGGRNITLNNPRLSASDLTLLSLEVSPVNLVVNGGVADANVTARSNLQYFGIYQAAEYVTLNDFVLRGTPQALFPIDMSATTRFSNFAMDGTLADIFNFQAANFIGTMRMKGVQFGKLRPFLMPMQYDDHRGKEYAVLGLCKTFVVQRNKGDWAQIYDNRGTDINADQYNGVAANNCLIYPNYDMHNLRTVVQIYPIDDTLRQCAAYGYYWPNES